MKMYILTILISLVISITIINAFQSFPSQKLYSSLKAVENIANMLEFENKILNSDNNSRIIKIIDFQKSKCAPCKKIAPKYHTLSEENKYKDKGQYINI